MERADHRWLSGKCGSSLACEYRDGGCQVAKRAQQYERAGRSYSGLAAAMVCGACGFIDTKDSMMIRADYELSYVFAEGLAHVRLGWQRFVRPIRSHRKGGDDHVWNRSTENRTGTA